jgi:hypothetical protein
MAEIDVAAIQAELNRLKHQAAAQAAAVEQITANSAAVLASTEAIIESIEVIEALLVSEAPALPVLDIHDAEPVRVGEVAKCRVTLSRPSELDGVLSSVRASSGTVRPDLIIPAGQTEAIVEIFGAAVGTFTVTLSNPTEITLGAATATGTILPGATIGRATATGTVLPAEEPEDAVIFALEPETPITAPIDIPAGEWEGLCAVAMVAKFVPNGVHQKFIGAASSESAGQGAFCIGTNPTGLMDVWRAGGGQANPLPTRPPMPPRQAVFLLWEVIALRQHLEIGGAEVDGNLLGPLTAVDGKGAIGAGYWQDKLASPLGPGSEIRAIKAWRTPPSGAELTALAESWAHLVDAEPGTPPPPPPNGPPPADLKLEPVDGSKTQVSLTVGTAGRQTIEAFGWSQSVKQTPPMGLLRAHAGHLFEALDTKLIRLWCHPREVEDAINKFVRSGFIDLCREHGVDRFLMGPEAYTTGNPEGYAKSLAAALRAWTDAGIPVTHSGVQNEPGSAGRAVVPASEAPVLYRTLKSELARLGIGHIKVLAPEFASADSGPNKWFDDVKANGAISLIDRCASHSYNMAMNPDLYDKRWLTVGKAGWMTEAGSAGIPSTGARFTNDLNFGAEGWVFFLGQATDANDPTQKLVDHNGNRNPWWYACMAISKAAPRGTRMRLVSPISPYTYGMKPKLSAACGMRPDGKWCFIMQNGTYGGSDVTGGFGHYKGETLQVTLTVPDLRGKHAWLNGWRVPGSGRADATSTPMEDGSIRVTLPAAHLVAVVGGAA